MTSDVGLRVADDVRRALDDGLPVLALESTIFTHGLPPPRNVEVAMQSVELSKSHGVVAATIGVVRGVPTVGLSEAEIVELCQDDDVAKISVRDLSTAAVTRTSGGTTIAATAFLAHKVGIKVFATGGLGGVHHGASESFDESADMTTLSRTPIALVSSGAKAILDIRATLERFETLSISVVGYRTLRYPGFYVTDSGHELTAKVDSPAQAADLFRAQSQLGIGSAILIANPIDEDEQLDPKELDSLLAAAWVAAAQEHVQGQDVTPFLLNYIRVHTDGRSVDANVALYLGNVQLGSQIAAALADVR
jgi:pseudouridine-5'-phosphate glycosidase